MRTYDEPRSVWIILDGDGDTVKVSRMKALIVSPAHTASIPRAMGWTKAEKSFQSK